jgi:hypothetical protein
VFAITVIGDEGVGVIVIVGRTLRVGVAVGPEPIRPELTVEGLVEWLGGATIFVGIGVEFVKRGVGVIVGISVGVIVLGVKLPVRVAGKGGP